MNLFCSFLFKTATFLTLFSLYFVELTTLKYSVSFTYYFYSLSPLPLGQRFLFLYFAVCSNTQKMTVMAHNRYSVNKYLWILLIG